MSRLQGSIIIIVWGYQVIANDIDYDINTSVIGYYYKANYNSDGTRYVENLLLACHY